MRTPQTKIYGHDLPVLPKHWHEECDCVPTVAYIRVSKTNKKVTIKSPKIQFEEILTDARFNKRKIVAIVFDLNVSGHEFDREALNEVMDGLRDGRWTHISVWKWSRWGRNLRASLKMLALVEDLGARVDSATEPFDQDTIWGEFSRDQMLLIADLQAKQIGQTWRSVHALRFEAKLPHSGRKRFGYDYITTDERDKHYELNEEEADALEWAYLQYLAGTGTRKIALEFNARGLKTEFGGQWTYQAVGKMLDTGFGAGLLRCRSEAKKKAMKMKGKPANTLASYDVWLPGKQSTVIDFDVWCQYKEKRESQAAQPPASRRAVHEISGLLNCGICSRRMTTHYGGKQRQHRWHCEARSAFHPTVNVSISNDDALMLVKDWLAGRAQDDWVAREARKKYERGLKSTNTVDQDERRIYEIGKQLDNLIKLTARPDASEATQTRLIGSLNALEVELAELNVKVQEAASGPAVEPNWVEMQKVVDSWSTYPAQVHNAALSRSIGMIVVSPPSAPRLRSELRSRVRIVPVWEMSDWAEWLSVRRQRSA